MKPKIHPDFNKINVTCACGNSFPSASTAKELKVEVCAACHPFFTGQQRFLDTAGRVERFQAKIEQQKKAAAEAEAKKATKKGAPKAKAAPAADAGIVASEK
ncbi:MAG TPA: 50S ribosomal protein L31 [Candidatus Ozemobacteraceae bacterium]|nr:50S ribosomal protein L31 [Candidatus Ozemobacteraceae bacterium]